MIDKNKIIISEILGFIFVIFFIWLNEIVDLPYHILGAVQTPVNFNESIFETCIILLVAGSTIFTTNKLIIKIEYLEGFLRICCVCKKIYDKDKQKWLSLESYFDKNSKIKFSHGLCPECAQNYE